MSWKYNEFKNTSGSNSFMDEARRNLEMLSKLKA
jgi:hypothetical protein